MTTPTCLWCGSSRHESDACHIKAGTCNRPDRDAPKMKCGYPLPCPWHTVVIDVAERVIDWPPDLMPTYSAVRRLDRITDALHAHFERPIIGEEDGYP